MSSHYYAMLFRMKYIKRWALMHNLREENLSEHSLETAFIAHALAVIENRRFNKNITAEKVCLVALFHDTHEILTGDLPTPVKYYDEDIKSSYKKIETVAEQRLINMIPEDLREDFLDVYEVKDQQIEKIVKAADKLSALIKCEEEISLGNKEFLIAKKQTEKALDNIKLDSIKVFKKEFLPSFLLPLDSQNVL